MEKSGKHFYPLCEVFKDLNPTSSPFESPLWHNEVGGEKMVERMNGLIKWLSGSYSLGLDMRIVIGSNSIKTGITSSLYLLFLLAPDLR